MDFMDQFNLGFDNILFESTTYRDADSLISQLIRHLFKLKYCTDPNQYANKKWEDEIDIFKGKILFKINKDNKKIKFGDFGNDKYSRYFNECINDIYEKSIKLYKEDIKEYDDLKDGLKYIPDVCPYTFEDIMNKETTDLLSMLPDMN